MDIQITDTAREQINNLMAKAPEEAEGLRLSIKATGCSGNSYKMEYVQGDISSDDVIQSNFPLFQ